MLASFAALLHQQMVQVVHSEFSWQLHTRMLWYPATIKYFTDCILHRGKHSKRGGKAIYEHTFRIKIRWKKNSSPRGTVASKDRNVHRAWNHCQVNIVEYNCIALTKGNFIVVKDTAYSSSSHIICISKEICKTTAKKLNVTKTRIPQLRSL